jgi:hypothetical protein
MTLPAPLAQSFNPQLEARTEREETQRARVLAKRGHRSEYLAIRANGIPPRIVKSGIAPGRLLTAESFDR